MTAEPRLRVLSICCLLVSLSGCALMNRSSSIGKAPLTAEQASWWEANKYRKVYIPGRGYQIPGVAGYFDESGHRLPDVPIDALGSDDAQEEGFLDKIAPKKAWAKFQKSIGNGPNEAKARAALAEGDNLFRQKEFAKAAKQFNKAYKGWPDSPLEEEAMFKAAECNFFADRYSKADDSYGLLTKKYPSTQYLSQVVVRRFSIGRYWEEYDKAHPHWPLTPNLADKTRPRFDTGGHALKVYERIRLEDPTGPLADDSIMATANNHFIKGRWDDADYHYGLLRTEYPKSEFQFQAHLLGLRCKLLKYQGSDYDGGPLDEAEEIATQLLTQFPTELGNERERIVQTRASLNAQRAKREWDMAEYYAKGKYFGASRHFYEKIIEEYPETQLAQESRARMETIKGEQAVPDDPFIWLTRWFPESKREGPVLPKTPNGAVAAGNKSTVQR